MQGAGKIAATVLTRCHKVAFTRACNRAGMCNGCPTSIAVDTVAEQVRQTTSSNASSLTEFTATAKGFISSLGLGGQGVVAGTAKAGAGTKGAGLLAASAGVVGAAGLAGGLNYEEFQDVDISN